MSFIDSCGNQKLRVDRLCEVNSSHRRKASRPACERGSVNSVNTCAASLCQTQTNECSESSTIRAAHYERYSEKEEIRQLNEHLAEYIEKFRFLEAQNKNLEMLLNHVKNIFQQDNVIQNDCEIQINEIRKIIQDTENVRDSLAETKIKLDKRKEEIQKRYEEIISYPRNDEETIDNLNKQVSEHEAEIAYLHRQANRLKLQNDDTVEEILCLREKNSQIQSSIEEETQKQWRAEAESMRIQNEIIEFKDCIEQEITSIMNEICTDCTVTHQEQWKQEMADSLHRLQNDYDLKMEKTRNLLESKYGLQIYALHMRKTRNQFKLRSLIDENCKMDQEIKEFNEKIVCAEKESVELKSLQESHSKEIVEQMKDQCDHTEDIKTELQINHMQIVKLQKTLEDLMDEKMSLDKEIACYRDLMRRSTKKIDECEEHL